MKTALDGLKRWYTSGVQRRILVVDDDPNILKVIQRGLGFEGFRVLSATSGEEALGVARDDAPDLIILDLMMPVMDGWQFRREQARDGSCRP